MKQTIDITRKTVTDAGHGSTKDEYTVHLTNVKASVQQNKIQDAIRAGRKVNTTAYNVYVPFTTDVVGSDRVLYDGDEYTIVSLSPAPSKYKYLYLEKIV